MFVTLRSHISTIYFSSGQEAFYVGYLQIDGTLFALLNSRHTLCFAFNRPAFAHHKREFGSELQSVCGASASIRNIMPSHTQQKAVADP